MLCRIRIQRRLISNSAWPRLMPALEAMLGSVLGTSMNVDNTGNLRVIKDASTFCSSSTLLTASIVPEVSTESIAFATSFSEILVACIAPAASVLLQKGSLFLRYQVSRSNPYQVYLLYG